MAGSEEFAWAAFADNGNVIIWSRRRDQVEPVAAKYGKPVVPVIAISVESAPAPTRQPLADEWAMETWMAEAIRLFGSMRTAMHWPALEDHMKEMEETGEKLRAALSRPLADERALLRAIGDAFDPESSHPITENQAQARAVGATRAALAQPIVSPAIEQQGGEPIYQVKSKLFERGWHDIDFAQIEPYKATGFETRTLYTTPTHAADAVRDAKDAARYRYLCENAYRESFDLTESQSDIDAAIDAAMSASQAQGDAA